MKKQIKFKNLENNYCHAVVKEFQNEEELEAFVAKELALRKELTNCDHAAIYYY